MDWLIGLLLFVVGGSMGFFVAKYFNTDGKNTSDSSDNKQTIQELVAQQASVHVRESKQIADNLVAQAEIFKRHIENYEQLLITQQAGPDDSSMRYFGEHATAYLRHKNTTPSRAKVNADIQPLDFSSQSSGLFSGNKETPAKESK